ncbi:uncharacterized protein [Temnothorax nylanderi]|uniref:uncharacterized protein isoform X2 n=1 Tax=Temnothorax nylanderi TaxID=102681 RepID=UPI003A85F047
MKLSSDESKELSRCSLSALPNEILLKTFKYLDLKTLCRMNEVNNRRFDILTRDPRLYTRLNMRDKSEKYMCDIFYYFTPRCKYLQQLDLKGSYFHVNDFINFLNNCGRRLTHLNLSYCTIHYSSTVFQLSFEISKTCKDLKELDLRFCQGMEYGIDVDNDDDEFLYLERLNNLECIMFSRLPITTENICKILQNNPQIREMDILHLRVLVLSLTVRIYKKCTLFFHTNIQLMMTAYLDYFLLINTCKKFICSFLSSLITGWNY